MSKFEICKIYSETLDFAIALIKDNEITQDEFKVEIKCLRNIKIIFDKLMTKTNSLTLIDSVSERVNV